ncbi:LysM peptidoglycan-binding domain-containing protein [Cytobacillus firmus]|jgi:3D (Asp-Asp-Asp) domain-containing protein/LysM repeat protein|uniref:LysM peptidoglycan-binding and 3D domain-containing protein n=1 Tax=Bacillaceae TaxID=186817 RepID=UPI00064E8A9B|nr:MULTISPECIES: 3D domain-containing protein [Bacillaceae]KML46447.1 peptidoglycan-binding protein [Cytobacillus firmus]MCC3648319.1 LysM peptidoglycan-binding domain-containing protein [Cytobacillus oceanisediminis]MCS0654987.1 LysM peptidoglycan-binding domain-containing protein [Cytobacillus firmus]USK38838.1 LysM peptidoglycan-binding domain-containing protein [Cytobacillus firmus]WHY34044.1 LysM peptidoglycan-binding domain-containing protein [Cytobacillus firmus]
MKKYFYYLLASLIIWSTAGVSAYAEEVTVNKGDTLWSIAQKHEVSVQDIKNWNGLSGDLIHPNDKLDVSPEEIYIVESGDTLWNIAKTYNISVHNLKKWNQLKSDFIKPGLELIIYKNESVKKEASNPKTVVKAANTKEPAAKEGKVLTVTATAYTASCEGCIGITKTGVNLIDNPDEKVIAVDPDVIPLGSKVFVEGYGYATAEDIGGGINGHEIDVFIPGEQDALQWGRKDVKVTILN